MDAPGQIRWLGQAVRPDVAVITNIDDVHLEHFGSRRDILAAKAEILEHLRPGGLAVLCGDDELLNTLSPDCETIRCGFASRCGVRVEDLEERGLGEAFIQDCIDGSVIDTGILPDTGDRLLTLSTCTGTGYATRWVVHAVLAQVY